jgi:hypothetical protein
MVNWDTPDCCWGRSRSFLGPHQIVSGGNSDTFMRQISYFLGAYQSVSGGNADIFWGHTKLSRRTRQIVPGETKYVLFRSPLALGDPQMGSTK